MKSKPAYIPWSYKALNKPSTAHCDFLTARCYLSCAPWMAMFMVTVSFVTVGVGPQRLASQYTLALETVKLLRSVG